MPAEILLTSCMKWNLPNVVVHGEISDAISFMDTYNTMVVPLFSGSGMRVKILEGMALGKTIITTGMGKEGIHAVDGVQLLKASDVQSFIQKISDTLDGRIDME